MRSSVVGAIGASAIGWGFASVGVRVAFEEGVTTFTVVDIRLVTATVAVVVFVLAQQRKLTGEIWRHGAYIGIPRIALTPVFFISSLQHISAGVEGLFITLIPVFTGIMGWLLIREHLTRVQVAGLVLGLVGGALIILSGESGLGGGEGNVVVGGVLALAGAASASLSAVISRKYAPLHDTADLAMPMFVTGTALAVVWSFAAAGGPSMTELTIPLWLLLVALGLGSTLLPFVGTLYAARYTSAARVAVTGYLAPVISVVGGVVLLDEVLTAGIVAGGVLALAGAVFVSVGRVRALTTAGS